MVTYFIWWFNEKRTFPTGYFIDFCKKMWYKMTHALIDHPHLIQAGTGATFSFIPMLKYACNPLLNQCTKKKHLQKQNILFNLFIKIIIHFCIHFGMVSRVCPFWRGSWLNTSNASILKETLGCWSRNVRLPGIIVWRD